MASVRLRSSYALAWARFRARVRVRVRVRVGVRVRARDRVRVRVRGVTLASCGWMSAEMLNVSGTLVEWG